MAAAKNQSSGKINIGKKKSSREEAETDLRMNRI